MGSSCFHSCEKKVGENFLVVLIGDGLPVIDFEFIATGAETMEVGVEGLPVTLLDDLRFGDESAGVFHVHETDGPVELEFDFVAVEEVEDCQIVFAIVEMPETVKEFFRVVKEVGENDDERAAANLVGERVQSSDETGGARRRLFAECIEDVPEVRGVAAGRDVE